MSSDTSVKKAIFATYRNSTKRITRVVRCLITYKHLTKTLNRKLSKTLSEIQHEDFELTRIVLSPNSVYFQVHNVHHVHVQASH